MDQREAEPPRTMSLFWPPHEEEEWEMRGGFKKDFEAWKICWRISSFSLASHS